MVRVSVPRQRQQDARPSTRRYVVLALFALVVFWTICFVVLTLQWFQIDSGEGRSMTRGHQRNDAAAVETNNNRTPTITKERILEPQNLSRSGKVVASSDVRGNLGPVRCVLFLKLDVL